MRVCAKVVAVNVPVAFACRPPKAHVQILGTSMRTASIVLTVTKEFVRKEFARASSMDVSWIKMTVVFAMTLCRATLVDADQLGQVMAFAVATATDACLAGESRRHRMEACVPPRRQMDTSMGAVER